MRQPPGYRDPRGLGDAAGTAIEASHQRFGRSHPGARRVCGRARRQRTASADPSEAIRAAGGRSIAYERRYGIGERATDRVRYPTNPPLNGPHAPVPPQDGSYAGLSTPPTEQLVHSLGHGRVHIQYRPGLPAAIVHRLEALFDEDPQHVLLYANRTRMPAAIAVSAWGHGALFEDHSEPALGAIRAFRDGYGDRGPELMP
jgi:Protein of unknown function (DUF3105)